MDTKPIKVKVVGMQHYEGQEKSKIEMVASAEITQVDGVINLVSPDTSSVDEAPRAGDALNPARQAGLIFGRSDLRPGPARVPSESTV